MKIILNKNLLDHGSLARKNRVMNSVQNNFIEIHFRRKIKLATTRGGKCLVALSLLNEMSVLLKVTTD